MKRTFRRRLRAPMRMSGSRDWPSELDWIAALFFAVWINALAHLLLG